MGYLSLKEYAVIGNQGSAVLVSRLGSIDWACLPYLDSPSHFGALLDDNQGGQFQIHPQGEFHSQQNYISRTNVLETHFETPTGRGTLTDWMPIGPVFTREPVIHRKIKVTEGHMTWVIHCVPRFGYGAEGAQGEQYRDGILFRGTAADDLAFLRGTVPLKLGENGKAASAQFLLKMDETAQFSWIWGRHGKPENFPSADETIEFWRSLAHKCINKPDQTQGCMFAGPWHDLITRSSLLLKLMATHFSGSFAEAVTTSLPSLSGGSRNWDYRYAWIRDNAMAIQALTSLGYREEAKGLFNWLSDILIRDGAEGLQAVYTLDGGRYLPEHELSFLSGYGGARPVRIGNLAARQFHLDIFGHVMLTVAQQFETYHSLPEGLWTKLKEIAEYVCQAWRRPDRGPWEIRSKPEHFVASKVLCWVALDRAIWLADELGEDVPRRWMDERKALHKTICDQGYDENRRTFVRAFGDREIDASALLIPLLGFLPPDDYRVLGTLDAVQAELSDGVLIHRSRTLDGLPETDGAHLLSSYWYVSCLALCGRVDEAVDRLAELSTYATPLGLFGEQVNPATGEPAGNFPSSSAHLALINASLYVGLARGRKPHIGPVMGRTVPTGFEQADSLTTRRTRA